MVSHGVIRASNSSAWRCWCCQTRSRLRPKSPGHKCTVFLAFVTYVVLSQLIIPYYLGAFTKIIPEEYYDPNDPSIRVYESVFVKKPTDYITNEFTKFILNPEPCKDEDALFLVSTEIKNVFNRQAFRIIYSNRNNTSPFRIKMVFLVGFPKNGNETRILKNESLYHDDIVQGSFVDHYANLTFKTSLGFRWASSHCRHIKLMLKIDDDVFVDVFKFMDFFGHVIPRQTRTINCFTNVHSNVLRKGKYRVPEKEYPQRHYPDFCAGFFIVPTMDIIDEMALLGSMIPFYPLEDVFTYGFVRTAMVDVQLIHLGVITYHAPQFSRCMVQYKQRCKYLGAQVREYHLLDYWNATRLNRGQMGLLNSKATV